MDYIHLKRESTIPWNSTILNLPPKKRVTRLFYRIPNPIKHEVSHPRMRHCLVPSFLLLSIGSAKLTCKRSASISRQRHPENITSLIFPGIHAISEVGLSLSLCGLPDHNSDRSNSKEKQHLFHFLHVLTVRRDRSLFSDNFDRASSMLCHRVSHTPNLPVSDA